MAHNPGHPKMPTVRSQSGILTNANTFKDTNLSLLQGDVGVPTGQFNQRNMTAATNLSSGGPPGSGFASQISRPSTSQPNRGYVSPAAVDRRATSQPSNAADRNMIAQANRAGVGSYNPNARAINAAALAAARYGRAAEVYADPVTGAPTPAYEAAQRARPMGGGQDRRENQQSEDDKALAAFLGQVESDDWKNFVAGQTAPAAPGITDPGIIAADPYADLFEDLRSDADTALGASTDYFENEGDLTTDFYGAGSELSDTYFDDRGTAAEDYFGGSRDDALEYLTGREGREQAQISAMGDMRRLNASEQYQHMVDALNAEQVRRSGRYDQLELDRGARLDSNEAALLSQMGSLEGERLSQQQAMMDAMSGRYTGAQGGLDLREQGVGPEAYTSAVGAETAALLGSQGLSSQDLQGRLASIAASEATDRELGATGLFQDARSALADELFGGRADLAENIAGRETDLGLQNMKALGGINVGELGAGQSLANQIAQGRYGANQDYRSGMYNTGENIAAGRFQGSEVARTGAFNAGQTQRAGQYEAQQAYNSELSRINQLEASGQISRAEAAQAKVDAEAKSNQAAAAKAAQFAQIDAAMGLAPGTAQAMDAGGLLGDLYGDLMGEPESNSYDNMMPWTPTGSSESYMVDPEIMLRAQIDEAQNTPTAFYPVNINGQMVSMPISGWQDVEASQEYEARR